MYPKTKRISKSSTEKQNILKTLLGYPFGDSSFQVLAVDPLGIHFSHGTEARIFASICDILKLWLQQCLISECFTYIPCGICCVDIFGNIYIYIFCILLELVTILDTLCLIYFAPVFENKILYLWKNVLVNFWTWYLLFFILLGYSFWNISRSEPCVTLVLNKSCNITSYTWPQSTHKVASSKEKMSQVYLKHMLKHKFQVLLKYISTTSQNTRLKYISSTPQNTSLTSTSQVHKKNNSSTSQVQKHF